MHGLYYHILKSIVQNRIGFNTNPHFITFLTTWRCNCKCIFCNIWKKNHESEKELNIEQIKKIFSEFRELDVLRITGGEPFLRPDLSDIINIINDICNPGMIHITTNGLLTKKIIDVFDKIIPKEKLHIKISIDDIGRKHDEVRGIKGIYDHAVETVEKLTECRKRHPGFVVGINQAITCPEAIESYKILRDKFKPSGVGVYPVIAHKNENALYTTGINGETSMKFEPFGSFTKEQLKSDLNLLYQDSMSDSSISERMVSRYFLRGLANRLLYQKNSPNPKCVALGNHLRILPDGSVPICFFNNRIVGNLKDVPWHELKKNTETLAAKNWVKNCPGCWESCEIIPSAAYTGDMIKEFF